MITMLLVIMSIFAGNDLVPSPTPMPRPPSTETPTDPRSKPRPPKPAPPKPRVAGGNRPNCKQAGGACGSDRDCCTGSCKNTPLSTDPGKCS